MIAYNADGCQVNSYCAARSLVLSCIYRRNSSLCRESIETDMTLPLTHTTQASRSRCAACGGPLTHGYFYLRDRPERYCPECIASRPRCDACSAPVGDQHWTLHDGRVLCQRCHATAIFDPTAARNLFDETVAAVVAQLDLSLRVGVEFRLVDAPTLAQIRASGDDGQTPKRRRSACTSARGDYAPSTCSMG